MSFTTLESFTSVHLLCLKDVGLMDKIIVRTISMLSKMSPPTEKSHQGLQSTLGLDSHVHLHQTGSAST